MTALLDVVAALLAGFGVTCAAIGLTGLLRTVIFDVRGDQGAGSSITSAAVLLGAGVAAILGAIEVVR